MYYTVYILYIHDSIPYSYASSTHVVQLHITERNGLGRASGDSVHEIAIWCNKYCHMQNTTSNRTFRNCVQMENAIELCDIRWSIDIVIFQIVLQGFCMFQCSFPNHFPFISHYRSNVFTISEWLYPSDRFGTIPTPKPNDKFASSELFR